MKKAILYTSKHGFTKECAEYLASKMENAEVREIQMEFDFAPYDHIIFGSFIYEGEIYKEAQKFLKKYKAKLLNRKLDIFCSGLDKKDYEHAIQTSLDPEIFYHASIVCPGGQIKLNNLSYFEKRTIKKRIGITSDVYEFYPERLDKIVQAANKGY